MTEAADFPRSYTRRSNAPGTLLLGALLLAALGGCRHARGADTELLNQSGMAYDSVKQLDGLNLTKGEVEDILKIHDAGFSDAHCVRIIQIFHGRGQVFDAGSAVSGLVQAGMSDDTILSLASLDQLGRSAGELEAMHLAGLSDEIVLEVARHRTEGKPVLSGASLARLKNMGVRSTTLLELARRDIPDSEGPQIASYRHRGASDAEILRRFSGS